MGKLSRSQLKNLKIEVTENGFTIWTRERHEGEIVHHWLIDASDIKNDGIIRFGTGYDGYNHTVIIDRKNNRLKLVRKK